MSVTAINKKGRKQVFSDEAWRLIRKNNTTWTEIPEHQTENIVKTKLPTGEKAKPVEQKVENTVKAPAEEKTVNIIDEKPKTESKISDEQKSEFLYSIDGLTRRATMDLVDKYNETAVEKISFDKKIGNDDLKLLLATALEFSTENYTKLSA